MSAATTNDRKLPALAALVGVVLAGCAAPPGGNGGPDTGQIPPVEAAPVLGRVREPVTLGAVLGLAEPNLAVAPDGTIYVASSQGLSLWRSDDGGRSFVELGSDVCSSFLEDCALSPRSWLEGSNDGSLGLLSDGTLVWVGLSVPANLRTGFAVPFQTSVDRGASWSEPRELDTAPGVDRPWLVVHPDDAIDVLIGHTGSDRHHTYTRSVDRGATWSEPVRVADGWPAGPLAAGGGRTFFAYVQDGLLRVATRSPEGAWSTHDVVALEDELHNFPVAAVDGAGNLHLVWAERRGGSDLAPAVWLSSSRNEGIEWTTPMRLSSPARPAVFPWIVAGDEGRLAVAWYEGRRDLPLEPVPNEWDVRLMLATDGHTVEPRTASVAITSRPNHIGTICTAGTSCFPRGDRTLGDFFQIALGPDGVPVVAYAGDATVRGASASVHFGGLAESSPLRE